MPRTMELFFNIEELFIDRVVFIYEILFLKI
jgi:hypothetical protein